MLGLSLALAGCNDPVPEGETEPVAVRTVEVVVAGEVPLEEITRANGTLRAVDESTLSMKVPGRLAELSVDMGSAVRRGQRVAQLEAVEYELRLAKARAVLAQARAQLGLSPDGEDDSIDVEATSLVREAKAVLDEAERSRNRVVNLSQAGVASDSEREAIESAHAVALNRYQSAVEEARTLRALLSQRRAELEMAEQELADTEVRAPFDGIVQRRHASVGEYLTTGAPVVTVVRENPLRLVLEIPETDAAFIRLGNEVRFRVEGGSRSYSAHLARLSPVIERQTRMLLAEADVEHQGGLRSGAFVRADIIIQESDPALAVPAAAVITFAGLEKVFVAEDGKARERRVGTGRRQEGWVEITEGVEAGETVILNPGSLRTGELVEFEVLSPPGAGDDSPEMTIEQREMRPDLDGMGAGTRPEAARGRGLKPGFVGFIGG